jgi:hypothetical protein
MTNEKKQKRLKRLHETYHEKKKKDSLIGPALGSTITG